MVNGILIRLILIGLFLRMGIRKENIVSSGICSKCNFDMVHSYRNEGKEYKAESLIIGLK